MIQKICSYIICVEISPFRTQIIVATVLLAFDNVTFPFSSIYFKWISNEWIIIGYIAIGITFLLAISSLFVPESPRFLADNGDFDKARVLINQMSKMNKGNIHNSHWKFADEAKTNDNLTKAGGDQEEVNERLLGDEQENNIEEELALKKSPIKQIIKQPRLGLNLLISTMCWIACSFNYFLLSYDIKNLGGNIFLNSSLIAFAGVGGKLITLGVRKYASSKISMMMCFSV